MLPVDQSSSFLKKTESAFPLRDKVLFITGASRGIGKEIAIRAARDGARIAVLGKTDTPHPKLEGTVHTACREIETAGGEAFPCIADVRNEAAVEKAVQATADHFGGIDILVNNASAISLTPTAETAIKSYDLMQDINTRGTFLCTHFCLPYLKKSDNPHILTLSPPLNIKPKWFSDHFAYTLSKYGMSLCTLGHSREFTPFGIAVNSLWPKTIIATAAVRNILGTEMLMRCRHPLIVADAAYAIITQDSRSYTGNFCIDEDILREAGVKDFSVYALAADQPPAEDLFM